MSDKELEESSTEERSRDRSPPFPFIPLGKAIDRAREFEAQYKRSAGRVTNVLQTWGYTAKSSGGHQTAGALKAFGLVEDEGSGADRKIKLTDLAFRILKDERPGKREEAIKEAALKPKAFQQHWELWGGSRPPEAECRSELTLERGYTEDAANRFIRVYDDTVTFAKLVQTDNAFDEELSKSHVKAGDFVQWQPRGILQFPEPRRVTAVADSGEFVFVEGSATGLPIGEVVVAHPADLGPAVPAGVANAPGGVAVQPAVPGIREDVWNLDEGPVVLRYPAKMSAASYEDFKGWIELQLRKIKRGIEQ